jgi:microcystin-dependent protein
MGQPYVGEIRMFGGNFAPAGWMFCDGQLLPISENDTLFVLIGTTYGGDGQATFALPDLRGRLPVHMGQGSGLSSYVIGQSFGVEAVTLTTAQMGLHSHPALCSGGGGTPGSDPANSIWGPSDSTVYSNAAPTGFMATPAINTSVLGGSQPHENMIPFLCVNYIISLFGIFPTQT